MEEVLPPSTERGAGFEPPVVRQFTVFLENRVGRLQTLVRAYEKQQGKVVALSIQNAADTALVRIICSDPDLARQVLLDEGFCFATQDVLLVELPACSTPLLTVTAALLTAELSIHYIYPVLRNPLGNPAIVLYVDDQTLASQILIRKQFVLIGESDLKKL